MMDAQVKPWSEEEKALLRSIWNEPIKVENFGELFPGRKPEAIYSQGRKIMKLGHRRVPQDFDRLLSWQKIQQQLELGPKTARQISMCTGMDLTKILEALRKRKGRLVRVSDWTVPGRGGCQQVWALGSEPDAPRPPKLTHAEVWKRYRDKMKRERPEELEAYAKKKRVREKIKAGGVAKRDPAASWF